MSYTVAIVIPPVASDDATAWKEVDKLIEEEGPRPEIFQSLHDQLTTRYPCLCSLPDEKVDDGVWSDGPLINNFSHRAAVLGISLNRETVLPFVIETANSLNLVVFDWQTEAIHRGGKLPKIGDGFWEGLIRRLSRR
jgi:hypothetical protein